MTLSSNPNPKTSRNVLLLGIVSLLNDISSEIIQPILPIFITSLGGGSLAIGFVGGISDGLPSIIQVFFGHWSDKIGRRKPLVVGGYALSAAAKLLFPLSAAWQQVFVIKTAERIGKGMRTAPRDAMISESVEQANRGRGFGLHRAMDTMGAVIGSLMAYALWKGGLDFKMIFLIAGILAIFALFPFIYVKEGFALKRTLCSLNISDLSPEMKKFMGIASLFAIGNFSYMFFILRAQGFFTGMETISDPLLLFAFTAAGFAYVSSAAGLVFLFALYGFVFAMIDTSQRAFASDVSKASLRSTSLGAFYGVLGIVSTFSGLIAGGLWAQLGPEATFLFGAAASALAALQLWRMNVPKLL